jgi:hypothetical protein
MNMLRDLGTRNTKKKNPSSSMLVLHEECMAGGGKTRDVCKAEMKTEFQAKGVVVGEMRYQIPECGRACW